MTVVTERPMRIFPWSPRMMYFACSPLQDTNICFGPSSSIEVNRTGNTAEPRGRDGGMRAMTPRGLQRCCYRFGSFVVTCLMFLLSSRQLRFSYCSCQSSRVLPYRCRCFRLDLHYEKSHTLVQYILLLLLLLYSRHVRCRCCQNFTHSARS